MLEKKKKSMNTLCELPTFSSLQINKTFKSYRNPLSDKLSLRKPYTLTYILLIFF